MKTVREDGPGGYALFDESRTHRLVLTREWEPGSDPKKRMLWIMLNPSTATASRDDPTVVRCARFARSIRSICQQQPARFSIY